MYSYLVGYANAPYWSWRTSNDNNSIMYTRETGASDPGYALFSGDLLSGDTNLSTVDNLVYGQGLITGMNDTHYQHNNPITLTVGVEENVGFITTSETYDSDFVEGEVTTIKLSLKTGDEAKNITTAIGVLRWNNTEYNGTLSIINTKTVNLTVIITVPTLTTTTNFLFNWSYIINFTDDTSYSNITSTHNQTGYFINITDCSNGYPALNFTIYDESALTNVITDVNSTMTFEIFLEAWKNETYRNFSYSFNGTSSYELCIFPNWTSYTIDATIQYGNATYPYRNYYLVDNLINNVTTYYKLYTLEDDYADKVEFNVVDSASIAVKEAVIKIQRYDYTTTAYITMCMAKSDDNGRAISYLYGNDIFYKFVIEKNGDLLADKSPTKIAIDPITNEGELTLLADPTELGSMYNYISSVAYGCSLNRTTSTLRCTLSDSTGDTQTVRLRVDKFTPIRTTEICDTSAASTATTLICVIPSANGTYTYRFYAIFNDGTEYTLEAGSFAFTKAIQYGAMGVLMALFLFLTMSAMGIYKPAFGLILGGGAILMASAMNILALEVVSGSIGGLLVVIAIIVYRMRDKP